MERGPRVAARGRRPPNKTPPYATTALPALCFQILCACQGSPVSFGLLAPQSSRDRLGQSFAHLLHVAPPADISLPTGTMSAMFSEQPSLSGHPGRETWTLYCRPPLISVVPIFREIQNIGVIRSSAASIGSSSSSSLLLPSMLKWSPLRFFWAGTPNCHGVPVSLICFVFMFFFC